MFYSVRYPVLFFLLLKLVSQLHAGSQPKSGKDRKAGFELVAGMAGSCCCGTPNELSFPNLDFEDAPIASPGGWIDYSSGQSYGPWVVTSGSISIHAPDHLNLGAGNPNGASQHLDLHGFSQGAVRYPLSGLTAGNMYTIEFWYAIHSFASNPSANLRVGGGAWLNVNWNASNPGNVVWLKASYMFTAQASSTTMEFSGSGSTPCCGMLIDDIKIFECPSDLEVPEILNAPQDLQFDCLSQVTPPDQLLVQDNCDQNPVISFEEKRTQFSVCSLEIIRKWTVTDQCKNSSSVIQTISVSDMDPPQFTKLPQNKIVHCHPNIKNDFQNFLRENGGARAIDNCSTVKFTYSYDTLAVRPCDSTLVDFVIEDDCGNSDLAFAWFIIIDTVPPEIYAPARDLILPCGTLKADSIVDAWIAQFGGSSAGDVCGYLRVSTKYLPKSGDIQPVEFVFSDRCGNQNSTRANIIRRDGTDTTFVNRFICELTQPYSDTMFTVKAGGCDSLAIVHYFPVSGSLRMDTLFVCDSIDAGLDTMRYQNQYGCDSVIVESRIFSIPVFEFNTVYECDLNLPITDTIRIMDFPCDKFRVLYRIPAGTPVSVRRETTCDSIRVRMDTLFLINRYGCDSVIVTLTELADRSYVYRDSLVCSLTMNYSDTMVFQTSLCDSVVVTRYQRIHSDTSQISRFSCNPADTGVVVRLFRNQSGCDSLVITSTELLPAYLIRDSQYVCRKTEEGILQRNYISHLGCDSIVITQKIYREPLPFSLIKYTCNRDSAGSFRIVLDGFRCDSIVLLDQRFIPPSVDSQSVRTCFRDSVRTETVLFRTLEGCDSILQLIYYWKEIRFTTEVKDVSCFGQDDGIIRIFAEPGSGTVRFFINGKPTQEFNQNLSPGLYQLRMQDDFGCLSEEQTIRIGERESLTVDAGPDRQIKRNQTIDFYATSNRAVEKIKWIPESFFDCAQCASTRAAFQTDTTILVTVTDSNGCIASDLVKIFIIREGNVYAPNVISVNGDQVNDRFYFSGPDDYQVRRLRIFDRWGAVVFEIQSTTLNDPIVGWDGSFRGKLLNPGVFAYVAEILTAEGNSIILRGDITLIQ